MHSRVNLGQLRAGERCFHYSLPLFEFNFATSQIQSSCFALRAALRDPTYFSADDRSPFDFNKLLDRKLAPLENCFYRVIELEQLDL